jgi:hypothetical protein
MNNPNGAAHPGSQSPWSEICSLRSKPWLFEISRSMHFLLEYKKLIRQERHFLTFNNKVTLSTLLTEITPTAKET